jgi:Tol biopolymer transport system component
MSIAAGTRLGPYEIIGPLGTGGMGDVYRARDTRLDRLVAVKTVKSELALDAERRARFEREAKTIASLTHPHICTLYDVGHARVPGAADDVAFLVMELIQGETLAERLTRGALPMSEALEIGRQVADALHRAHREGIVHRDLKPANIMLARSGATRPGLPHVKLLDFGLARLRADRQVVVDKPTQTSGLTTDGVVLGTLQYIAPEQLEGRAVDQRADLFALGAILYEMVSGRRAFQSSSAAGLISAILSSHPARLSSGVPMSPAALDRIVAICLAKNPDERWASAHDIRLLLDGVDGASAGTASARESRRRERIAWGAAAVAALAALVLGLRPSSPAPRISRDLLSILPPDGAALTDGEAPQISPDGRLVAFVASDETGTVRLYAEPRARVLSGTNDATQPFWAPDSRRLGFFGGGRLKRIDLTSGIVQTLAAAPVPRGGTWNQQDVIVYTPFPAQATHQISAAGGTPTPVAGSTPNEGRWFPFFLPDGRHYLYLSTSLNGIGQSIHVAALDSTDTKELVQARATARFLEPGYLLFRREESLVAQPFDPVRLELDGTPVTLADGIGFNPITYQSPFSASIDGTIAYTGHGPGWEFVWVDRTGRQLGVLGQAGGGYNSVCLSADDTRLFYDAADIRAGTVDIWSIDVSSGNTLRLTSEPAVDFYAACAPKGIDVVFASLRGGVPQLYRGSASAPGSESQILKTPAPVIPNDWSSDGRLILYATFGPKTNFDIWALDLATGKTTAILATEAEERNARLSPDGRWLTYTSDRSGTYEVWVQPYPATGAAWQVSSGGGRQSAWRRDGRELFYISSSRRLMAVDVTTAGQTFSAGASRVIAETRVGGWERTNQGQPFAVTRDGQRFLISNVVQKVQPISIALNWLTGRPNP